MGHRFIHWNSRSTTSPKSHEELRNLLLANRAHQPVTRLEYGDHGLQAAETAIVEALRSNQRIALYADYDVDGTMSCVCWIWFLKAIGYTNFTHYIPCRVREGYGLNIDAVRHLIENEKVQVLLTMDTGITANREAAYCREQNVTFICTDHHHIQPDKMPDCIVVNPKQHPDPQYQELCGCGITFVLLRRLAHHFTVPNELWTDLLALTGMATICDIVPLNGVNHKLAKSGVEALSRSRRPVLAKLRIACAMLEGLDEKDVGYRLGPRINAIGRLEHADTVIQAFIGENPDPLIAQMENANQQRQLLQASIVKEAREEARKHLNAPVLFLGGNWHPGVVGIAASKLVEEFWRPVWLFQRTEQLCKGSARSIEGFHVTEAMQSGADLFQKFGGHQMAGGFTFAAANEASIRQALMNFSRDHQKTQPHLWESKIHYDCFLTHDWLNLGLAEVMDGIKPFGNSFEEPRFCIEADLIRTDFYKDKQTGQPRHTAVTIASATGRQKILFFNQVFTQLIETRRAHFIVSATRNTFRGETTLSLIGHDFR